MSDQIQEIQRKRFLFLQHLYEVTGGDTFPDANLYELGNDLGFTSDETDKIDNYLTEQGLVEHIVYGGVISITHAGVIAVEAALTQPDEPTPYFPAVNIIQIKNMTGSQIQQGTQQSNQTVTHSTNDLEAILSFANELKGKLSELELDDETQEEVKADIATIESQAGSPRPKYAIIKECLASIRIVLEGAAGNVIAAALLNHLISQGLL